MKNYRCNNLILLEPNKMGRTKCQVRTPDGRILEEFNSDRDAVLFMQDTRDFLTPAGLYKKYGIRKFD